MESTAERAGVPGTFTHDYEFLCVNIAQKYAVRGVPVEDLIQQGLLELLVAEKKWDPVKGTRNKYAAGILHFTMIDVTWRRKKYSNDRPIIRSAGGDESEEEYVPIKDGWFSSLCQELSEEAKFLATLIVNAPMELAKDITPRRPKKVREALKTYLIDIKDWEEAQFERIWNELDQALGHRASPEEQLANAVCELLSLT